VSKTFSSNYNVADITRIVILVPKTLKNLNYSANLKTIGPLEMAEAQAEKQQDPKHRKLCQWDMPPFKSRTVGEWL
jgi:hypothetical protein